MYCAVAIKGGKVKPSFHGTIADVDAAAQAAGSKGADAYFALASFDDPALGRTAANAVYLRCFFLDLDVGPTKAYATQSDAAKALRQFINTTGLPLPIIVSSGGGLHVYWPLTEDVPAKDWVEHAKKLKTLCKLPASCVYPAPRISKRPTRVR
jgi:DNA primase